MTAADSRQGGVTPTERFLVALCERSFFALWCYPNVFHDQGHPGAEDGKEVCDVLVVFREHVILFSDKRCAFPPGDVNTSWRRWYKRAIHKSAQQLHGAERWLTQYQGRIFLDRRCTQRLPIDLPSPAHAKIHRIVVAQGAAEACAKHFGSAVGSLLLCPSMRSPLEANVGPEKDASQPFVVGRTQGSFVHVFDEVTLPTVMEELDTIADFVSYLSWKESFIESGRLAMSAGEEHLVAYYLTCLQLGIDPSSPSENGAPVFLTETFGPSARTSSAWLEERERLRVSYEWDRMIEMLCQDILEERTIPLFRITDTVSSHEQRSRALASAPRHVRVGLVVALREILQTPDGVRFRAIRDPRQPDTLYLFLVLKPDNESRADHRRKRATLLHMYALKHGKNFQDVRHIIGVSTGPDDASHEVVYIDRAGWSAEDDDMAADARRLLDSDDFFA